MRNYWGVMGLCMVGGDRLYIVCFVSVYVLYREGLDG